MPRPKSKAVPPPSIHAHFTKLFDFEQYGSSMFTNDEYQDFLKFFMKPKIREIVCSQMGYLKIEDQDKCKSAWKLFEDQVMEEFPICRLRRDWLSTVRTYAHVYIRDLWSRSQHNRQHPRTFQKLPDTRRKFYRKQTNPEQGRENEDVRGSGEKANAAILLFLDACNPSLRHLLPIFIRLGLHDQNALMERIRPWRDEDIKDALNVCLTKGLISSIESDALFVALGQLRLTNP